MQSLQMPTTGLSNYVPCFVRFFTTEPALESAGELLSVCQGVLFGDASINPAMRDARIDALSPLLALLRRGVRSDPEDLPVAIAV